MSDLVIYGHTYNNAAGFKAKDTNGVVKSFYNIDDATLSSADQLLDGVTAYSGNGKFTGNVKSKSAIDVTVSGKTVTVPKGNYTAEVSKSVASGSASTPATSVTANPSITVSASGLITASVSAQKAVTPSVTAGWVESGTSGNVTVSGSNTEQLEVQAAKTVTPSETAQTAVESGKYTTGAVTVGAISSTYVGSEITKKAAATYNTSSSDQVISAGQYLNGAQTIKAVTHNITAAKVAAGQTVTVGDANDADRIASVTGTFTSDANATAADIASGKTAYVNGSKLTGSLSFVTYYTGSSAPSSSLGSDGDIYLQT